MFSSSVSGLGHCAQPINRTLVAIEEVSYSRSGPQSAAVKRIVNLYMTSTPVICIMVRLS